MIKHILSFSLLVLSFSSTDMLGQANLYFQNNPVWNITEADGSMNPCIKYTTYNYYTGGDTVIGSYTYKKILTKGQGYYSWMSPNPPMGQCTNPPFSYNTTNPIFLLRSVGKKIYIKTFVGPGYDTLLYNFNLKVGDTLPQSYNNWMGNIIKVTAIDSIYTFNGYMKRFALTGCPYQYLIEGIGHSGGLVEDIGNSVNSAWTLNCYGLNNTSYYPPTAGPACMLPLGINAIKNEIDFRLFPNPTNGILYMDVKGSTIVEIYNNVGEKLFTKEINSKQNVIDLNDQVQGMYFVRIRTGNEIVIKKIIKE